MAKRMKSAAEAADKWATGFGGAGTAYAAGIDAVDVPPGQLAVAAVDRYASGVQANIPKWVARTGSYPLAAWKDAAKTKGGQRLASGATAGKAKYMQRMVPVMATMGSVINGLPPRGTVEQNVQRSSQFQLAMHQAAQQGF
jgi:hypothetical protein